jgi:hypothetical protein
MTLTRLEQDILHWYADHSPSDALRRQCISARCLKREFTGAGMFLEIAVSEDSPRLEYGLVPNAPILKSDQFPYGVSVELWCKDGKLDFLELSVLGTGSMNNDEFEYQICESV